MEKTSSSTVGTTEKTPRNSKLATPRVPRPKATATSPVGWFACQRASMAWALPKTATPNARWHRYDTREKHKLRSSPAADTPNRPRQ